jgi:hypothetical protein
MATLHQGAGALMTDGQHANCHAFRLGRPLSPHRNALCADRTHGWCRLLLPEPPPWGIREVTDTDSSRGGAVCRVVVERLPLTAVTRDAADAWRDAAAVAVLDSGHHSALAAAVRLSAVYRLRRVCLLTLDASTLL